MQARKYLLTLCAIGAAATAWFCLSGNESPIIDNVGDEDKNALWADTIDAHIIYDERTGPVKASPIEIVSVITSASGHYKPIDSDFHAMLSKGYNTRP